MKKKIKYILILVTVLTLNSTTAVFGQLGNVYNTGKSIYKKSKSKTENNKQTENNEKNKVVQPKPLSTNGADYVVKTKSYDTYTFPDYLKLKGVTIKKGDTLIITNQISNRYFIHFQTVRYVEVRINDTDPRIVNLWAEKVKTRIFDSLVVIKDIFDSEPSNARNSYSFGRTTIEMVKLSGEGETMYADIGNLDYIYEAPPLPKVKIAFEGAEYMDKEKSFAILYNSSGFKNLEIKDYFKEIVDKDKEFLIAYLKQVTNSRYVKDIENTTKNMDEFEKRKFFNEQDEFLKNTKIKLEKVYTEIVNKNKILIFPETVTLKDYDFVNKRFPFEYSFNDISRYRYGHDQYRIGTTHYSAALYNNYRENDLQKYSYLEMNEDDAQKLLKENPKRTIRVRIYFSFDINNSSWQQTESSYGYTYFPILSIKKVEFLNEDETVLIKTLEPSTSNVKKVEEEAKKPRATDDYDGLFYKDFDDDDDY